MHYFRSCATQWPSIRNWSVLYCLFIEGHVAIKITALTSICPKGRDSHSFYKNTAEAQRPNFVALVSG
jgi:hypothetical protein